MKELRIQGLKGFERLMNSTEAIAEVYLEETVEVYTTVDLPWLLLSKVKTIQLVDGLLKRGIYFIDIPDISTIMRILRLRQILNQ